MTKTSVAKLISFAAVLALAASSPALADEAKMLSMMQDMQKQMGQMQNTIDWQGSKIRELEGKPATAEIAAPAGGEGGVELPKWLEGVTHKVDLRLRYEAQNEKKSSTTNDRNRFRYRLRWEVIKEFNDQMKAGFRLVSGPLDSITSTNETFDTNFGFKGINIDRVYATYTPNWAKVELTDDIKVEGLEITAGKFANPFTDGSTIMIWDGDVTPEGIFEKIKVALIKAEKFSSIFSFVAGQLILEEGSGSENDDAELFAFQTGFHNTIDVGLEKPLETKHLFSYYNYADFTGAGNFAATNGNFSAVIPRNPATLAAGDFDIVEVYNEVNLSFLGLPKTKLFFDWAQNVNEGAQLATAAGQNDAWGLGIKIGKAKKKGDWEVGYEYYNIEANSVPGVFNDSDFGHSDRRGSKISAGYAITDYLKLNFAAFVTNRISAETLSADEERKLFQTDLLWTW